MSRAIRFSYLGGSRSAMRFEDILGLPAGAQGKSR